ncbi:putative RNA-binding protein YlxR (DUF448 family) [Agrobacterium pusense]|nr:putative RNA-binding protein YlxR (DUF448 family) [Agrobacterium pusense]
MTSQAHEPDELPETDDDGRIKGDVNGRMCIVTRQSGSPDELIRFVAGPDGDVVPDLKRQLPGRGCWVNTRARPDRESHREEALRAGSET